MQTTTWYVRGIGIVHYFFRIGYFLVVANEAILLYYRHTDVDSWDYCSPVCAHL